MLIMHSLHQHKEMMRLSKAFEDARLDSAITASIDTYKEFGLDDEKIVKKIMERFGISFESAIRYVNEANLTMA